MSERLSARLCFTRPGTPTMVAERDRIVSAYAEARKILPDGSVLSSPDLHAIPSLVAEIDAMVPQAESRLRALAKRAGLDVAEKPDIAYGMHVGIDGPIECWFQMSAG